MIRVWFFLLLLSLAGPVWAAEDESASAAMPADAPKEGIVLPRFAALRYSEVNMRTGPGTRYPIDWVYRRPGMPVEIVAAFDIWYRIRDFDGDEGWVHKTKLRMQRRGMAAGKIQELRAEADDKAGIRAHLEPGVTFDLKSCAIDWCEVRGDGFRGYLRKADFFGAYPKEIFE